MSELINAADDYVGSIKDIADYSYRVVELLRSAFIAGAEWQQKQSIETAVTQDTPYQNLIQVIKDNLLLEVRNPDHFDNAAEIVAEAIKAYVASEIIEAIRAMVKSNALTGR